MSPLKELLCEQARIELKSALMYLNLSARCSELNWCPLAEHYIEDSKAEVQHYHLIREYMLLRGWELQVPEICSPKQTLTTLAELASVIVQAEKETTDHIYKVLEAALAENDHKTYAAIQPLVNVQLEEDNAAETFQKDVEMYGGDVRDFLVFWTTTRKGSQS